MIAVRSALRGLRRAPGFAIVAVLILALGIGLSTAVFAVADALLIRRLPMRDQNRLIVLWGEKLDGSITNFPLSLDQQRAFAAESRTLARTGSFLYEGATPVAAEFDDRVTRMRQALVSGEFFEVLGARSALGRGLRVEDDVTGAAPVAVLSHSAWRRFFGGDRHVIGRRLFIHETDKSYTIVGVMPRGIDLPRQVDYWAAVRAAIPQSALQYMSVDLVGRLAPGATPGEAAQELTRVFARENSPWARDVRGVAHPLPEIILGDTTSALFVFAGAAGLLLLITCINVANLLLVRGLARVRELTVRAALGASRLRIVALLLTESSILALLGGALGVGIAMLGVRAFVAFAPATLPRLDEVSFDGTAFLAAVLITAVASLTFATFPALRASRMDLQQALRSGGRSQGAESRRAADWLVSGQIALAIVVLSAAMLIGKSFLRLAGADLAFDPSRVVIAELALSPSRYPDVPKQRSLINDVLREVRAMPGVHAVSTLEVLPFVGRGWEIRPLAEGQSSDDVKRLPLLKMDVVEPEYFTTFGIPIVRGRAFTASDRAGAVQVVMLSESAAQHYWPGANPIGKRVIMGSQLGDTFTVAGVVRDTRFRDLRSPQPAIYFPLNQSPFPFVPATLAIRAGVSATSLSAALRRLLRHRFPGVVLSSAAPIEQYIAEPLAQPKMNTFLLAVFAGAAVALAGVGLLGVMMVMVRQRTRELGVRMALGATKANVYWLVLRRALAIGAMGIAAGLAGAWATNRAFVALLYDVSPADAATLSLVVAIVGGVVIAAALLPARLSVRVDPAIALRADT